jgi:peptidoglycan hydrolase-like amidase
MRLPRALGAVLLTAAALATSTSSAADKRHFAEAIDALSVGFAEEGSRAQISYETPQGWSKWQDLAVENEQDPTLLESNLVMFPSGVTDVRLRGDKVAALHSIRVTHDPAHYDLAATGAPGKPKILSRDEWGADDSFLFRKAETPSQAPSEEAGDNGDTGGSGTSQRAKDCQDAQLNYPNEFKTIQRVTKDADGNAYRWPQDYSGNIKLLVVHHTAMKVTGDARSGEERVRALYQYHANSRGWGDIGYHFLVDDSGQIYEGKAGGRYVVGGHAYCNNVGTIGIALLGNFEEELPSQQQMKSLQWLLAWLGDTYEVPLAGKVKFHGKSLTSIVGHRDLLSTDCPGMYAYDALTQVRSHVASGQVDAPVTFPSLAKGTYTNRSDERKQRRISNLPTDAPRAFPKEGISPLGTTKLDGRPGAQMLLSMRYQAGSSRIKKGSKVAEVNRSAAGIGLWQEVDGTFQRVSSNLEMPQLLPEGGSTLIRLKVQFPSEAGGYVLTVGPWTYQLEVSGRRSRQTPAESTFQRSVNSGQRTVSNAQSSAISRARSSVAPAPRRSSLRSFDSSASSASFDSSSLIRIRLYQQSNLGIEMNEGTVNGQTATSPRHVLTSRGSECVASAGGREVAAGIVRFAARIDGTLRVTDSASYRGVRGSVECRVVDGQLMIINELPLEHYLWGLAEEPDTEPYEKQRAFAITARTYAAYYMDPAHRKFPGKPYDGSDSPAEFQAYKGTEFEGTHTEWVRAVRDTKGLVMRFQGKVIRPPYFSSDDGRTRTPVEAGWGSTFPFAEIFTSKDDPWCDGMQLRGHGVGMSGCGSEGQANEGKKAEEILQYYYPGTTLSKLSP